MEEIIYFSVNNWFCGRDFPDTPKFREWLGNDLNLKFQNSSWAKENKLCIHSRIIDMSVGFSISAPKNWVLENCPEIIGSEFEFKPGPGENCPEEGLYGVTFLEYCPENLGVTYSNECDDYEADDEDE